MELFGEYRKVKHTLIDGEGLTQRIVLPSVNEIRNGFDDIFSVLARAVPEHEFSHRLADATRHFRRARSEVWEAVLLVQLETLKTILDSLQSDPKERLAKAIHYSSLSAAFDHGRVALSRAKETKHSSPDEAMAEAKGGITKVRSAITAFMEKAGHFSVADAIRDLHIDVSRGQVAGSRQYVVQIGLSILIFALGVVVTLWTQK